MAIWVDAATRVVVQGMTGGAGKFHAKAMLEYGTRVVAGVTPGKGGQQVHGVPVFNTMEEAVEETGANASVVFVPGSFAADAVLEASAAKVEMVICITEGVPILDMVRVRRILEGGTTRLVGPNCPGIISPGLCKVGIMPGLIHQSGRIGVVSRSGTLTYEAVGQMSALGIGQSTCVGIGGDPVLGVGFVEVLRGFQEDPHTDGVVLIGEIGGSGEEEAARIIGTQMNKPVVAYVAGLSAPPGKMMGHAGAIIRGGRGRAEDKVRALESAGVVMAPTPAAIGATAKAVF